MLLKNLKFNEPNMLRGYFSCDERKKNGLRYLVAKFTDLDGEVANYTIFENNFAYNIFKNVPQSYCECEITYLGENNGGYKNYVFNNIKPLMDPNKGILCSISELDQKLQSYISLIKDPLIKEITLKAYEENKDVMSISPASMLSGYSYEGGLLAQTVRLCDLVSRIYNYYNETNYNTDGTKVDISLDALISASILCDLGAINYYYIENNKVEKKKSGKILSKDFLCIYTASTYLNELFKYDIDKFLLLSHIIETSNGKIYGNVTHRTPEANILASAKELDKSISNIEYVLRIPSNDEFVKLGSKEYCLIPFDNNEY